MKSTRKATAIANANIALVKYWGKRDEKIVLPENSSISITLDALNTTTTIEFNEKQQKDTLKINGENISGEELKKIIKHLDIIRVIAGTKLKARIESTNNFPKAAGLASSASAFAALTLAATTALGLKLEKKQLSIIARQGSGSASRSIYGGFVEWQRGEKEDGSDSYAYQIVDEKYWPEIRVIVLQITEQEKKVKSREGMKITKETSPLYKAWLETIEKDIKDIKQSIKEKDIELLGKTAQVNAIKMHATAMTAWPTLIYWQPETIKILKEIIEMQEQGTKAYFTIDGGPQVKVICLEKDLQKILKKLSEIKEIQKTYVCKPGEEAKTITKHLF
ncbi:MAG: diphosphomevalonate decarboxylase [Candidatus Diapherotrites archaeon]